MPFSPLFPSYIYWEGQQGKCHYLCFITLMWREGLHNACCNAKSVFHRQSTPISMMHKTTKVRPPLLLGQFYFFATTTFPAYLIIATGCKGCNLKVPTQIFQNGSDLQTTNIGVGTFRDKRLCPSHSLALWGKDPPPIPILWNRAVAISTLCT